MQILAVIADVTGPEVDTVIIWHDGQRPVAYAYQDGRVTRTAPVQEGTFSAQLAELRQVFGLSGGTLLLSNDRAMAPLPATLPPAGPRRWG